MFGLSYGEIFLLLGATAALIGPKDLPVISRTAGRLAGRAIGYVQLARGQFESVMQQSQVSQVHKELQDTLAQLEAIRYEIRGISLVNPGPLTRRLDNAEPKPDDGNNPSPRVDEGCKPATVLKDYSSVNTSSTIIHSQAMVYSKLAESQSMKSGTFKNNEDADKLAENVGLLTVLPVSAESAGFIPKFSDKTKGSDIVLEAILEAEVARNAKDFFSQPQNQIPSQ
uniref:Sec-independent protein translocase protein TatB n=1 Tax=Anthurium amnicola TaxID=1678845 RepID=A0A1D1Y380_9ARAE